MSSSGICFSVLCAVVLLFDFSNGACKYKPADYRIDRARNEIVVFCSHRGVEWSRGMVHFDQDCEKCYCNGFVMQCCESRDVAGVTMIPGCRQEMRGCKVEFYRYMYGLKINCRTGQPFEDIVGF
ncbi:uncharacterized protein LOC133196321 [Saccostrea echinata]|uniref:uncharacterized protein LOC133196321 n=1 Tax=Saccostrea echinata TaxID=191078 RepID=UPI002A83801B|nr:uncharacterized protein LOC133196321 [Saccostrea echinata]